MKDFLQALNDYPWTSFFVFLGAVVILGMVSDIIAEARRK